MDDSSQMSIEIQSKKVLKITEYYCLFVFNTFTKTPSKLF